MTVGATVESQKPLLVVRLVGGLQFSFFLDQKILEHLRLRRSAKLPVISTNNLYRTVAEDIEWLHQEWCGLFEPPSEDDLRRGSAALRRLLVENEIHKAWRHLGFPQQARIIAPDLNAFVKQEKFETSHVGSLIVGGATISGIQFALLGFVRTFNPETGNGPDSDEGFAVKTFSVSRDARTPSKQDPENSLEAIVNKEWGLSKYLNAAGAVRLGKPIKHQDIIKYFANYAGGVHLDDGKKKKSNDKTDYALIAELRGKVAADKMDGLDFALLSIGQAIGRSPDLLELARKIRENL
ncbi:hypothetical protein [Acidocella facilis]|uniref:hypothetical protein n=1 Tax=Acidocella facilis TaxID=525 RepID=UPI001F235632|nr:hypothetical protein [Acidocella facilis]